MLRRESNENASGSALRHRNADACLHEPTRGSAARVSQACKRRHRSAGERAISVRHAAAAARDADTVAGYGVLQ